jgi:hypothetical protein
MTRNQPSGDNGSPLLPAGAAFGTVMVLLAAGLMFTSRRDAG